MTVAHAPVVRGYEVVLLTKIKMTEIHGSHVWTKLTPDNHVPTLLHALPNPF